MNLEKELKLGITNVGKLLLENKFSIIENKEEDINDVKLGIPEYQRPYKWDAERALQLYYDIFNAYISNKEEYRLGTLIFHKDKANDNDIYYIVDGQQRIITISLLLSCFVGESNIRFLEQKLKNNYYNDFNVYNNYKAIERQITNLGDKEKDDFYDYVKKNCEFVIIITEDQSEAFQFFDSQNARGKSLYVHDLLKAYHLREMNSMEEDEVEKIVKMWEDLKQDELSELIVECLYRLKEWIAGYKSEEIVDSNKDVCVKKFKGITNNDNYPYSQYYKCAYAYANDLNNSNYNFVTGRIPLKKFQINSPIIAGKAFFEYIKHYYEILVDIKDNSKYEGYFVNDNDIVKMIDENFNWGTGNLITRKLFNMAILLYIDRFCPVPPTKNDIDDLNEFINYAFVWAYSLRFQYKQLGWVSAKNYIIGNGIKNSFNLYKIIIESRTTKDLTRSLSKYLMILNKSDREDYIYQKEENKKKSIDKLVDMFIKLKYWEGKNDE